MEKKFFFRRNKGFLSNAILKTLKSRVSKCITSISRNLYIDKLDGIVNKYNNAYHGTIKMKPVDVKRNTYIKFGKELNYKDPKFQVDDHVRI